MHKLLQIYSIDQLPRIWEVCANILFSSPVISALPAKAPHYPPFAQNEWGSYKAVLTNIPVNRLSELSWIQDIYPLC